MYSWVGLYRLTDRGSGLGWDLLTPWRAERIFAHGGAPYAVKSFVYPPSCLLLLRPLGSLTRHQLTVGGLVGTLAIAWVSVMLSAHALGKRWWGITAALTIWLLHFTEAMRGELSLENVTVLAFLGLGAVLRVRAPGHWIAAGAAIGLSLSVKPLLLVVLLVFLLARQWKAFAVAVAIPALLNLVAFAIVADPSGVWSKLPSILNRSGYGVNFNSAWVDVARVLGLPEGVSILLRLVTVALVVLGASAGVVRSSRRAPPARHDHEPPANRVVPVRDTVRVPLHAHARSPRHDGDTAQLAHAYRDRSHRDVVDHGTVRSA